MESPATNSSSLKEKLPLTEKLGSPAGAPRKRLQQSHTRAQKEDFLAAAARLGSVAAAAKDVGINRSTCQKWANAAGIRPQRLYAQPDKDQFYAVLDRTGTITATAGELGLTISTARNWAGRANPAAKKPRSTRAVKPGPAQRHGAAVMEEFLRVLSDVGSVSVAARELGLKQSTCFNWARAAGVVSLRARRPSTKQTSYLQLRRDGASRRDAAAAV